MHSRGGHRKPASQRGLQGETASDGRVDERYCRETVDPPDAREILEFLRDANDFPQRSRIERRIAIDQ